MDLNVLSVSMQIARLILAIVLAVLAQYIALKVFDRMTPRVNAFKELRKGNIAVGIILGAVVLSVATIIAGGVSGILIPSSAEQFIALSVSFFWLVIAVILAILAQFVAINLFGTLTKGIDEQKEIKKGNLAVAVTLGAIIYSIAVIIQAGLPAF